MYSRVTHQSIKEYVRCLNTLKFTAGLRIKALVLTTLTTWQTKPSLKKVINMLVKCKCKHAQQDALHGEGNRVANPTKELKGDGTPVLRCTVCGSLHN